MTGSESRAAAPDLDGRVYHPTEQTAVQLVATGTLPLGDEAGYQSFELRRKDAPLAVPDIKGTTDSQIILAFSDSATNATVRLIGEVEQVCRSVSPEYRISCLGDGFKWVGKTMPNRPDYRAARSAISKAGSRLQSIAKQNRDRGAPVGTTTQGREWKARKKFTPVEKSKLRSANAAAVAAIQEAETRLLRAGENSDKRRVHYQRIAAAMGSTKRILRS
ncbi:MAG: hypothetical protein AAGL24_05845 [Pseudomonadota bacterium]